MIIISDKYRHNLNGMHTQIKYIWDKNEVFQSHLTNIDNFEAHLCNHLPTLETDSALYNTICNYQFHQLLFAKYPCSTITPHRYSTYFRGKPFGSVGEMANNICKWIKQRNARACTSMHYANEYVCKWIRVRYVSFMNACIHHHLFRTYG